MSATIHELRPRQRGAGGPDAERVRGWLMGVSKAKGMRPGRLATEAGIAPSTLTRFMNGGTDQLPKLETLELIARVAGVPSPAQLLTLDAQPFVDVPVVLPAIFRKAGEAEARMRAADTTRAPARFGMCVAVRVTADTGALAGVLLGDTVLVDPHRQPRLNDLVVVALDTGAAGVYRMAGPLLIPQGIGNLPSLPASESCVMGVAVQVQRNLD